MKKSTLLFLILSKALFGQQVGFEKTYKILTNSEAAKSCIQDIDENFVIGIGPKLSTSSFLRDYGLMKLNYLGDTLWYTTFFLNYNTTLQVVKKTPDMGYITIGAADDSVSGNQQQMLWIAKFDSSGFLKWTRFYSQPQLKIIPEFISAEFVNGNNLFICTGFSQFVLLDSTYNISNIKNYPFYNHSGHDFSKEISISANGNFWYYTFYQTTFPGSYKIKYLEVNAQGDSIKTLTIANDSLNYGRIVKVNSTYFIAVGYKVTGVSQSTFFVSKIDSSGSKIWSKALNWPNGQASSYEFGAYTTLINGNTAVCFTPSINSPNEKSFIYCFNNNGDSLWTQYFKNDSLNKTNLLDIVATSDSGLMACGQIEEPGGILKDYIVKTNANGVILTTTDVLQNKNESYLHIYPNPASSYTNLHYVGSNKNSVFTINTLQGQVIYEKPLKETDTIVNIKTTQFPPGFYICSVYSDGKISVSKKLVVLR